MGAAWDALLADLARDPAARVLVIAGRGRAFLRRAGPDRGRLGRDAGAEAGPADHPQPPHRRPLRRYCGAAAGGDRRHRGLLPCRGPGLRLLGRSRLRRRHRPFRGARGAARAGAGADPALGRPPHRPQRGGADGAGSDGARCRRGRADRAGASGAGRCGGPGTPGAGDHRRGAGRRAGRPGRDQGAAGGARADLARGLCGSRGGRPSPGRRSSARRPRGSPPSRRSGSRAGWHDLDPTGSPAPAQQQRHAERGQRELRRHQPERQLPAAEYGTSAAKAAGPAI